MHKPIRRPRVFPGERQSGAILCVVVGFLLGILFLGIIGRYGVPMWTGVFAYIVAVASAFLVAAGFVRGE